MKTFVLKAPDIKRNWYIIDANGKPLGRVAAKAAMILMGKNKATYTPHLDDGDFVVVVNAGKVALTGRKAKNKMYYQYSGFVGGMRETPFKMMMEKHPCFPIEKAVKGMLPKNRLAKVMAGYKWSKNKIVQSENAVFFRDRERAQGDAGLPLHPRQWKPNYRSKVPGFGGCRPDIEQRNRSK